MFTNPNQGKSRVSKLKVSQFWKGGTPNSRGKCWKVRHASVTQRSDTLQTRLTVQEHTHPNLATPPQVWPGRSWEESRISVVGSVNADFFNLFLFASCFFLKFTHPFPSYYGFVAWKPKTLLTAVGMLWFGLSACPCLTQWGSANPERTQKWRKSVSGVCGNFLATLGW